MRTFREILTAGRGLAGTALRIAQRRLAERHIGGRPQRRAQFFRQQ